jgi:hypothetical protein
MAVASLPLVYLGLIKDFWEPFEWYLKVEKGLAPTYFFIPFKNRAGEKVSTLHAERRASAYDINDVTDSIKMLMSAGSEIGVHGIDAWHSVEKAREELERIKAVTGESEIGIRMHWLLRDDKTCQTLEKAGYQYDSISRVAGQREPAPPSKFSNEGGFRNSVFKGIGVILYSNIPARPVGEHKYPDSTPGAIFVVYSPRASAASRSRPTPILMQ